MLSVPIPDQFLLQLFVWVNIWLLLTSGGEQNFHFVVVIHLLKTLEVLGNMVHMSTPSLLLSPVVCLSHFCF